LTTPVSAGDSPGIESCDSEGNSKDTFDPGESVYVKGSGLSQESAYEFYIVLDYDPWLLDETSIWDLEDFIIIGPLEITTDAYGKIEPTLIWDGDGAEPGYYDIWANYYDMDYYDDDDRIDDFDIGTAGFFVIPEIPLGAITVLLVCFAAASLKRRKFF